MKLKVEKRWVLIDEDGEVLAMFLTKQEAEDGLAKYIYNRDMAIKAVVQHKGG